MANQIAYEALNVTTAAVGPTAATVTQLAKAAVFFLEPGTGQVRHRADGTAPTASVGLPIQSGGHIVVVGNGNIINAQFFRHSEAASDGTLHCMYYDAVDILSFSPNGSIMEGPVASDAAERGNPVQIGGSVDNSGPVAAGEGDVRRIRVSPKGFVLTTPYISRNDAVDGVGSSNALFTSIIADDTEVTQNIHAAIGYAVAPDGNHDRLRTAGNTANKGLGALMVSPTGHAHNSVTADEQILGEAGKLHTITVHDVTTGGVLTVYDSTAESGTVIATLTLAADEGFVTLHYDVYCGTGIYMGYDTNLVGAFTVSYSV